ncbi:MAG: hypothetical protein H3C47_14540 [Candidatus Cloacimonetes bacterium]|nr:hypothetical protein [Candidatus Cloacimonadota bacterium]
MKHGPDKLWWGIVFCLLFCGCFSGSRPDPKNTFERFVKACSSADVRNLQMLLTTESWIQFQEELRRDYGSFEKGINAIAEQTKNIPPQFVRVEPVQKHLLERIYFQRDQMIDYIQIQWNDNQWKISLRSAEVNQPTQTGELKDFSPSGKE